jgi:hypothetical protein
MGLTIEKEGSRRTFPDGSATVEMREMTAREKLEAELAGLTPPDDPEAERIRWLQEEIAFRKAEKSAKPNERIGHLRVEPGHLIFRQIFREEFERIDRADQVAPGKPPMTEAQAADATRIATEQVLQACLKSPDWGTFQQWLVTYPTVYREYSNALNDHNSAHRRERAAK